MSLVELWTKDIFFDTTNQFIPTPNQEPLDVLRMFYGQEGDTVYQSKGFEANSKNFRIRDVLVKKMSGNKMILDAQLCAYLFLGQQSHIHIPQFLINCRGEYITEHEGYLWVVMEYIDGTFYRGTIEEMAHLEEMMISVEQGLRVYARQTNTIAFPSRPSIGNENCSFPLLSFGTDIDTLLRKAWGDIETWYANALQKIPSLEARNGITHIDLHPRNILVVNGKLYLLDFDSLQKQSLAIAYNFAAYKMLRRAVADGIETQSILHRLFERLALPKTAIAAQAEILFRLLSILRSSSPANIPVWQALIPVHVRGLYEADILLGD